MPHSAPARLTLTPTNTLKRGLITLSVTLLGSCAPSVPPEQDALDTVVRISRADYENRLAGFWLGQSIANWTGLVTEMDKIGGDGEHGKFYTRADWGQADQPAIWGEGKPSDLSPVIEWVIRPCGEMWGADDDTDLEYMYQHLLRNHPTGLLSPADIRSGWLTHIYSDAETPFIDRTGEPENYLWVSNQRAFDLMQTGMLPPATSAPEHNPHFEMIDAQLSTEIFGLYAPHRPELALQLAHLPIRTTARQNAAMAAEFYVIMHALAISVDKHRSRKQQILWLAAQARTHLANDSYLAGMYDYVERAYLRGVPWEQVRNGIYQRYQVEQADGYDISSRNLYCNGCFAAGINFAASLISLFYGEGDYQRTVKLAVLMGWDADNPAATWGGLLGFMYGNKALRAEFDQCLSNQFHIHRTRRGFDNNGVDTFTNMAQVGANIVETVFKQHSNGTVEGDSWSYTSSPNRSIGRSKPDQP